MTVGRVGRVTTARFQRAMHANHRAGCQFGIEYGAAPSCTRSVCCIARLGFELGVELLGIEVSVFRSARDSVAGYSRWGFRCDFARWPFEICLCHRFPSRV